LINLKNNNNGYSFTTGMVGWRSISRWFYIIKSELSTATNILIYPDGILQIGYEDLTATSNTRFVIGDITSSFCCFYYAESQVGEMFVIQ
jgi:hypothetical protein